MIKKISEFNKQFSTLVYKKGVELIKNEDKHEQINGVILLEISVFFGKRDAKSILEDNGALLDKQASALNISDKKFNLFIKNRLGIGKEINIKESNAFLKKSLDMNEPIGTMHAAIVELIRGSVDNYEVMIKNIEQTQSAELLSGFVKTGEVDADVLSRAISEYIL